MLVPNQPSLAAQVLHQYVPTIFQLLNQIASDMNRSESLMRACMGVIGLVTKRRVWNGT